MADDPELIRLVRQIRWCAVIVAGASLLWVVLTLFPELPSFFTENRIIVFCVAGLIAIPVVVAWAAGILFSGERS